MAREDGMPNLYRPEVRAGTGEVQAIQKQCVRFLDEGDKREMLAKTILANRDGARVMSNVLASRDVEFGDNVDVWRAQLACGLGDRFLLQEGGWPEDFARQVVETQYEDGNVIGRLKYLSAMRVAVRNGELEPDTFVDEINGAIKDHEALRTDEDRRMVEFLKYEKMLIEVDVWELAMGMEVVEPEPVSLDLDDTPSELREIQTKLNDLTNGPLWKAMSPEQKNRRLDGFVEELEKNMEIFENGGDGAFEFNTLAQRIAEARTERQLVVGNAESVVVDSSVSGGVGEVSSFYYRYPKEEVFVVPGGRVDVVKIGDKDKEVKW